jgi:hypothetical protein
MPPQIFPGGSLASGRITPASFPFYTTGEDNLRLVSYNSAFGVTLQVVARTLDPSGRPTPSVWPPHTPKTDRSLVSTDYALSGTTLLNVRVIALAGASFIGQTYVELQLIRGIGTAAIVVGTVLAGYITLTKPIGWPGSPIESSLDGPGYTRTLVGTAPAAGSEIQEVVPTGARWEPLGMVLRLTTSAAAGNRTARVRYFSNATSGAVVLPAILSPAASTREYLYAQSLPFAGPLALSTGVSQAQQALPQGVYLTAGESFQTLTDGLNAADAWSQPIYVVREWLEP